MNDAEALAIITRRKIRLTDDQVDGIRRLLPPVPVVPVDSTTTVPAKAARTRKAA